MAKYNRGSNSILSFVALIFFSYFIALPLVIAALMGYFGSVAEIIVNVIGLIPFGEIYYEFAIQIVNSLAGQVFSYINLTGYLTTDYIIRELAKELFTVIIFEALRLGSCILLGFVDADGKINPEGIWNKAKCFLITAIVAIIAACLSPIPLNIIFSNLYSLVGAWSSIISVLLSGILVGGGVAFFIFLNSLSIVKAIVYVFFKFFFIGICRISIPYFIIFMILIGWQNKLFLLSVEGGFLLLVIGLILSGIEMLLELIVN